MYKTTLYLPLEDVQRIRQLSVETPRQGVTWHIRRALREYLQRRQTVTVPVAELWQQCRGRRTRRASGDAVTVQRRLRDEWDD